MGYITKRKFTFKQHDQFIDSVGAGVQLGYFTHVSSDCVWNRRKYTSVHGHINGETTTNGDQLFFTIAGCDRSFSQRHCDAAEHHK